MRRLGRDASERRHEGHCLVEGVRIASEYVASGLPVAAAAVSPRLDRTDGGASLRATLAAACANDALLETTDAVLERIADTRAPQGVLLAVPTRRREDLPVAAGAPALVAWELQDPGNAGTLVRTAEASGCAAVVLARGPRGASTDPWSPRAVRASAGSAFRIPVHEWSGEPAALAEGLARAGFRVVACLARGGDAPESVDLRGACALVIGAETRGVPDGFVGASRVTIPLAGAAESLNAAAAAAVVSFEATRQRRTS